MSKKTISVIVALAVIIAIGITVGCSSCVGHDVELKPNIDKMLDRDTSQHPNGPNHDPNKCGICKNNNGNE